MGKIEIKGLSGLSGLSDEERQEWINRPEIQERVAPYKHYSPVKYAEVLDRAYRNDLFKETFQDDALFNSLNAAQRDNLYKEHAVHKYIDDTYAGDPNLRRIQGMTTDGILDFLENSNYKSPEEISKHVDVTSRALASAGVNNGMSPEENGMYRLLELLFTDEDTREARITEEAKLEAPKLEKSALDTNAEILDTFIKKDSERRIQQASQDAEEINQEYLKSIELGDIQEDALDTKLEQFLQISPHYNAFKDSEELKNLSLSDKIKMVSTFQAVLGQEGSDSDQISESAYRSLDVMMQNYISDNQNGWDWTRNTLKNAFYTGLTSAMVNTYLGYVGLYTKLFEGQESYQKWLEGYDEDGTPLNIMHNPLYWQGVDMYNTFDAAEINKIRESGGISKYNNIVRAGEELDLTSWNTVNEVIKQSKYITASLIEALAMRGMGSAFKGIGNLSGVTKYQTFNDIAKKTGAFAEIATQAMSQAQMEAIGSYQDALEANLQMVDKKVEEDVEKEMLKYVNSEQFDIDLAKQVETIKSQVLESRTESDYTYISGFSPLVEKEIQETAIQQVTESMRNVLRNQISPKYNADREQAKLEASNAAATTATIQAFKTSVTNASVRKFIFNKSTRETVGLNNSPKMPVTFENGKLKLGNISSWNKYAKSTVLTPLGEGIDEFSDSYINAIGKGFATAGFEDYLMKTYDPDNYISGMDNGLAHLISGFNDANSTFADTAAYYEGAIGALSGVKPNINYNGIIDTYRVYKDNLLALKNSGMPMSERKKAALIQAVTTNEQGENLTLLESIGKFVTNGIIDDINNISEAERNARKEVARVNSLLEKNKDILGKAFELAGTIRRGEEVKAKGTILDNLDHNFTESFTLISALEALSKSNYAADIEQLQNINQTMDRLSKGEVTDEDITMFLGDKNNKSVANKSQEEARAEAKKRIIENATSFIERRKKFTESLEELNSNENTRHFSSEHKMQLVYYQMAKKNWESRVKGMSSELGIVPLGDKRAEAFGSMSVINQKAEGIASRIENIDKDIDHYNSEIKRISEKENLTAEENLKIEEFKYMLETTQSEKDALESELKYLETIKNDNTVDFNRVLSENEIANLEISQLAFMLDKKNRNNYSIEQQKIIDSFTNKLLAKDASALIKINDIAVLNDRLAAVDEKYSKSIQNPALIESYISGLTNARHNAIRGYYITRVFDGIKQGIQKLSSNSKNVTQFAANYPSSTLELFTKENPEYADILQEAKVIAAFREDTKAVIDKMDLSDSEKDDLKKTIIDITSMSSSVEEAVEILNHMIDNDRLSEDKKFNIKSLMEGLESLENLRVANKIVSLKEKRNREAKLKAKREEQKKKTEEVKNNIENASKESPKSEDANLVSERHNIEEDMQNLEESFENSMEMTSEEAEQVMSKNLESYISRGTETEDIYSNTTSSTYNEELHDSGEELPSTSYTTFNGNVGLIYSPDAMRKGDGRRLIERNPNNPAMKAFLEWVKASGFNYQEVIDTELYLIAKLDPEVRFLTVKPENNATKDMDVQNWVFNVVEYTDDIKRIHPENKGSIVSANGKKWLVIGVLGGKNKKDTKAFKEGPLNTIKRKRKSYFEKNPKERFFVDTDKECYTKIVGINAGTRVRGIGNEPQHQRSILELLDKDSGRNPMGFKLEDLKWGIQQYSRFAPINFQISESHITPKTSSINTGKLFLMLPNADGILFPIAMKSTTYQDIDKNSDYYRNIIEKLLKEVTSFNYEERLEAVSKLCQYLHFDDTHNILIGTSKLNKIAVKMGNVKKTFVLDANFKFDEFLKAIEETDFYIDINPKNMSDNKMIEMMATAGVLKTDVATLSDHGATYDVYRIDNDLHPIETIIPKNEVVINRAPSTQQVQRKSIKYNGIIYRENADGTIREDNTGEVKDENLVQFIKTLIDIQFNGRTPVAQKDGYNYYIISNDINNPKVIKINTRTAKIMEAPKEAAIKMIENYNTEALNTIRENNAKAELAKDKDAELVIIQSQKEDIEIASEEDIQNYNRELNKENNTQEEELEMIEIETEGKEQDNGIDLNTLCNGDNLDKILDILEMKAKEDPSWDVYVDTVEDLKKLLDSKGVKTSGITNVEKWFKCLQECK